MNTASQLAPLHWFYTFLENHFASTILKSRKLLKKANMINHSEIEITNQRSLERVKHLGEVFTPPSCVDDMLKLLGSGRENFWGDENNVFFEPNCGHGNIVLGIYRKRLHALCLQAKSHGRTEAALYAVANTINSLWAIDIDVTNVRQCRARVLHESLTFLKHATGVTTNQAILQQYPDFIGHLLCAIQRHIQENETLSSLSSKQFAYVNASKTKSGGQWFVDNGHHPIVFDLSWVEYYKQCQKDNLVPFIYEKALRFITNVLTGDHQENPDFDFASSFLVQHLPQTPVFNRYKQDVIGK